MGEMVGKLVRIINKIKWRIQWGKQKTIRRRIIIKIRMIAHRSITLLLF